MQLLAYFCIVAILSSSSLANPGNNYRDLDICNHWNGRRHFLELGERGDLHARNVTTSAFRSTLFSPSSGLTTTLGNIGYNRNRTSPSADIWYQCNLELVTCAECVIRITFMHSNFSKTCERIDNNINGAAGKLPTMCPCEHIQFSEPPYDTNLSGQEFCGNGKVFRSKTRTLLLKFFYRATNSHVFSLQYFSERNVKVISGSPKQSIVSNYSKNPPEVISTPYFPIPYPRDYGIEHILTCEADDCQVRLDFTDFQLGLSSTLEIFDSNGQMLDSYTGEHFRPPITMSNGKSLLLQFRGNGASGVGFRAEVTFISSKQLREDRLVPFTDCGGIVSGPGGAITMMNMIENATDVRYYDCIWIIKPGNNYMMMKSHISLRIEEFSGMASHSDLVIRQGTTSDAAEIEKVSWPNNGLSKEDHILPILTGFYIRLRGVFGISSKLAIVYSVFNYLNCYIGSEFLCGNNHCISIRLHCDSFDHCGDGTDEPDSCKEDWADLHNDRRWYSHKPNYYFPKIEQYPDLKTATGIFIISTLGIFAVLSGWMIILYRMGVRARQQRELQSHLQTISELLDRQEEMPPDDPPSYEAPPDYEEVIKVGMEQELREPHQRDRERERTRHRNHHHHRHRERSCGRAPSNLTIQSNIVPIHGQGHGYGHALSNNNDNCELPSSSAGGSNLECNTNFNSNSNVVQTEAEKIANRVLMAAALCGTAEASRSKNEQWQSGNYKSVGVSTSPASISSGCDISATSAESRFHPANSSYGTPSQFEECSRGFGDDSLNISFSLAIPQSTASTLITGGISASMGGVSNTENEPLQGSLQGYKVERLRHTFSTPEDFAAIHDFQLPDVRTYGTNLPHDSCNLSGATNFGSDLSELGSSSKKTSWSSEAGNNEHDQLRNGQKLQHCALLHFPFNEMHRRSVGIEKAHCSTIAVDSNATLLGLSMEEVSMDDDHRKRLIVATEPDSDCEQERSVFCFGSVNRARRQRHVRSRSLTSNVAQRNSTPPTSIYGNGKMTPSTIKRSLSADLLGRITASIPRSAIITAQRGTTSGRERRERKPVYI